MFRRRRHFVERAVDAIPDFELGFEGLEMDVAGAVLDGLLEDQVDELDDGNVVGEFGEVGCAAVVVVDDVVGFAVFGGCGAAGGDAAAVADE